MATQPKPSVKDAFSIRTFTQVCGPVPVVYCLSYLRQRLPGKTSEETGVILLGRLLVEVRNVVHFYRAVYSTKGVAVLQSYFDEFILSEDRIDVGSLTLDQLAQYAQPTDKALESFKEFILGPNKSEGGINSMVFLRAVFSLLSYYIWLILTETTATITGTDVAALRKMPQLELSELRERHPQLHPAWEKAVLKETDQFFEETGKMPPEFITALRAYEKVSEILARPSA